MRLEADVFILVKYLYLVTVDDSVSLGWRFFPNVETLDINFYMFTFRHKCDQSHHSIKSSDTQTGPTSLLNNRSRHFQLFHIAYVT